MISRIYGRVDKLTTTRNLWGFGLIATVLSTLMLVIRIPDSLANLMGYSGGQGMFRPDAGVFSNPETLYTVLAAYGDTGRQVYFYNSLLFDIAYPVFYSLALAILLNFVLTRLISDTSHWKKLSMLPLLGGLLDLLENLSFYALIAQFPTRHDWLAVISNYLTTAKTLIIYPCFLLLLLLVVGLKLFGKRKTAATPV
jgi:hypothetical protein